jgi:hypothetical protein
MLEVPAGNSALNSKRKLGKRKLGVAAAAAVAAALAAHMASGTGLPAVGFAIFHHRIGDANNAGTLRTSTFD